MRSLSRTLGLGAVLVTFGVAGVAAQNAQLLDYVASTELRRNLEAHDFDVAQMESVVNGIARGVASGDLTPILALSAPRVRVTDGAFNSVIAKDGLAAFRGKLLDAALLGRSLTDENQMIVRGDEIGLAGGEFWIAQQCADAECSKKKSAIVTINLP